MISIFYHYHYHYLSLKSVVSSWCLYSTARLTTLTAWHFVYSRPKTSKTWRYIKEGCTNKLNLYILQGCFLIILNHKSRVSTCQYGFACHLKTQINWLIYCWTFEHALECNTCTRIENEFSFPWIFTLTFSVLDWYHETGKILRPSSVSCFARVLHFLYSRPFIQTHAKQIDSKGKWKP